MNNIFNKYNKAIMTWLMHALLMAFLMNSGVLSAAQAKPKKLSRYEFNENFFNALYHSNFGALQQMIIDCPGYINEGCMSFGLPLQWAMYNEKYELCRFLLQQGANPNIMQDYSFLRNVNNYSIALLLLLNGATLSKNELDNIISNYKLLNEAKDIFKECPCIKSFLQRKEYQEQVKYEKEHPKEVSKFRRLREFLRSNRLPCKKLISLEAISQLQEKNPGKDMPYEFIVGKIAEFERIIKVCELWPDYGGAYIQYLKAFRFNNCIEYLRGNSEYIDQWLAQTKIIDLYKYFEHAVLEVSQEAMSFEEFVGNARPAVAAAAAPPDGLRFDNADQLGQNNKEKKCIIS